MNLKNRRIILMGDKKNIETEERKMKKTKKYFPLVVGCIILLSVVAYGTRAWFTDSASEEAGIELTLGNVEITSEADSWKYEPENTEYNKQLIVSDKTLDAQESSLGETVKIKNARPGDSFSKVFTFKNIGSLASKVAINHDMTSDIPAPFSATFEVTEISKTLSNYKGETVPETVSPDNGVILKGNEEAKIELVLTVDTNTENEFNYQKEAESQQFSEQTVLNLFDKAITVELIQADENIGE